MVANTCGQHYLDRQGIRPFPAAGSRIRILCFAAPHKHKRVDIVPQVAKELIARRPDLDFEFVTTINEGDSVLKAIEKSAQALGVESRINNLGPVPVAKGPELYESCHICFLPTVLECFRATYPEAMAMGLPIVTTDLGFFARRVPGRGPVLPAERRRPGGGPNPQPARFGGAVESPDPSRQAHAERAADRSAKVPPVRPVAGAFAPRLRARVGEFGAAAPGSRERPRARFRGITPYTRRSGKTSTSRRSQNATWHGGSSTRIPLAASSVSSQRSSRASSTAYGT